MENEGKSCYSPIQDQLCEPRQGYQIPKGPEVISSSIQLCLHLTHETMFYLFDIAFLFLSLTTGVFNASVCHYTEKRTNTEIRIVLRAADDIMEMMTWVRPGKSSSST